MGPMGGQKGTIEKAKDTKGTIKKLFTNYLSKYKMALFIIIILAIGSTIFSIVGPKILGNATTEIFEGLQKSFTGEGGIDFNEIKNIAIILVSLYIISAIFSAIQSFSITKIAQNVTYRIREDLIKKMNKLPMKYFDKKTNGEVLSVITNDIDTLSTNLNQSVIQIVTSSFTIIGILIMMLSISWQMTVISMIILPISGIIMKRVVKKSQKYFDKQQESLGHVNGIVEETYGGLNIVKAFNGEKKVVEKFERDNEQLYKSGWKSQFLSGLMFPIMNFIGNIGYVAVTIVGGYFAATGTITVGNIQSFIQYNRQFTQPIAQLAQTSSMIQSMIAAAERVFEFLEQEEEIVTVKGDIDISKLEGNVEFKNVKFGYDPEKTIINNFNAEVHKGQKIAIVGPTGAGKTTMVKLLMRFYDVNSGSIMVDGKDIRDFERGNLRKMFGMVLQDTWLFSGSILDNIRYGKEDVVEADVIEAAKAAHVHHYIKTLPNGYHSELNEESSNISAGQKQLLTIARVILADPKILILDEATSSIDTRTEIQIQSAMDNLMKGRTSFIIAHRLSTIKNADLILVMNKGDIVEQGSHEQLLEANGFYSELYNSQFDEEEE